MGATLCRLYPFFFYGNVGASLMNMVAITINRYIVVQVLPLFLKLDRLCRIYPWRSLFLIRLGISREETGILSENCA